MAYIYKTIMKAENHDFDICQNRSNSRQTIVFAVPKGENGKSKEKYIGVIQNKTGKFVVMNQCGLKPATIEKLRNILSTISTT